MLYADAPRGGFGDQGDRVEVARRDDGFLEVAIEITEAPAAKKRFLDAGTSAMSKVVDERLMRRSP